MQPGSQRIRLGTVGRPHGLKGALRVNLDNPGSDSLDRLFRQGQPLFVDGVARGLRRASPLGARGSTRAWLVELEGLSSTEEAQKLFQRVIEAERTALGPLDDQEFYYTDLIGLLCVDEKGASLGTVAQVYEAGASDILVVKTPAGERELPFIEDVVIAVELMAARLVLRLPDEEIIEASGPPDEADSDAV